MPFLRMLWCLSLGLTNALQFTGPKQINADDDKALVVLFKHIKALIECHVLMGHVLIKNECISTLLMNCLSKSKETSLEEDHFFIS